MPEGSRHAADFPSLAGNRAERLRSQSVRCGDNQRHTHCDDQRRRRWLFFLRTLLDLGPGALVQALRAAVPVGAIRTPFTTDDVLFAWQEAVVDGGRRIILITDRPMIVWQEAMGVQGSEDAFTVIEIRLTADDEGEGKAAIGSNVHVDRSLDLIELKDYAGEPVRLIDVRPLRTTTDEGV